MEPTLDASIARLFGGSGQAPQPSAVGEDTAQAAPAAPPVAEPTAEARNLAAEARAHYDRAMAAQRAGDWAKYGEEIRLLGQVLEHMKNR